MVKTDVAAGRAGGYGGDEPAETAETADTGHSPRTTSARRRVPLGPASIIVLALGLAISATLALTTRSLHNSNEDRLLHQRVTEAGAVLSAAVPSLQTPLSTGAVLAEATHANRAALDSLMAPFVASKRPYVSVSVWPQHSTAPRPLLVFGAAPELASLPAAQIRAFLEQTAGKKDTAVLDLLGRPDRRIGYAFSTGPTAHYVVYGEASYPENRRARVDTNSAFADLDYAIYLGATPDAQHLIASSAGPITHGRVASDSVPFGDTQLRIFMTPRRQLGGNLLARLSWLIAVIGSAMALAAAVMTERLVRRRADAERLAQQNARLFSEQRSVAQTLQHSLLPEQLPDVPGLELAVRYVPGVDGVDIGGDWYDVVGMGVGQVMVVVGDVSGRGLRAATVMASLRYAIRAYVAQGDEPGVVLLKLAKLIDVRRDGHFATVLCGLVDIAEHTVTFANAGHPNPLAIGAGTAEYVTTAVGPPVGVAVTEYRSVSVSIPPHGTLLAFTDGLYERRRESPDVGLARLRATVVSAGAGSLDGLLDNLLRVMTPDGAHDDTAILGLRWRS